MFNDKIIAKISTYYPKFKLKFKNESWFMKMLGKISFWNQDFMEKHSTTIGNKVYFPSKQYIASHPVTTFATLLHELVHIYDSNRLPPGIFLFLFFCPQILILLLPVLSLLLGPFSLLLFLCLLPLPAYFRMNFERRAYLVSLYVLYQLNQKFNYKINLEEKKRGYLKHFSDSSYYFMWPFKHLEQDFDQALEKIQLGQHPFTDKIFVILDDILNQY